MFGPYNLEFACMYFTCHCADLANSYIYMYTYVSAGFDEATMAGEKELLQMYRRVLCAAH